MTISTHVLDTSIGRPGAGVTVRLERQEGDAWIRIGSGTTDDDGRVKTLVTANKLPGAGLYRLTFGVGAYFDRRGVHSFYGDIAIEFIVRDGGTHYHVPLLVSPFGYSTYRGS
jgi:5-hydroxyisourate hydrolase